MKQVDLGLIEWNEKEIIRFAISNSSLVINNIYSFIWDWKFKKNGTNNFEVLIY